MISAVKRMHREAVACDENKPRTENTVMAVSLKSKSIKEKDIAVKVKVRTNSMPYPHNEATMTFLL